MRFMKKFFSVIALFILIGGFTPIAQSTEPKTGNELTSKQYTEITDCFFKPVLSDYSWNRGWIKSVFFHSGVMDCLGQLVSSSNLYSLEILSGLKIDRRVNSKIITKNEYGDSQSDFLHINPMFIRWVDKNFSLAIKIKSIHKVGATIYEANKDFVRSFAIAYWHLSNDLDIGEEARSYKRAYLKDEYIPHYLRKKYNLPQKDRLPSHDQISLSVGFWLRRYLDGSIQPLKTMLMKLLKTYDNAWYTAQKAQ